MSRRHGSSLLLTCIAATGAFGNQGLAALRRSPGGDILLDQGSASTGPKAVRVRVEGGGGKTTGSSAMPSLDGDEPSIERLILQARNTIYEEELFYELGREARLLANQGVRMIDSTIVLALSDTRITVDLLPLEDESSAVAEASGDAALAEGIATTFRILLSHAHRQNLRRRSQIPAPLTERKRATPPYWILRAVLTHLLHRSARSAVHGVLHALVAMLEQAGLDGSFGKDEASEEGLAGKATASRAMVEQTVERFVERSETSFRLTLPAAATARIRVRTQLHPPSFGSEYLVSTEGKHAMEKSMVFSSMPDMLDYLHHLTTLAVVAEIAALSVTPTPWTRSAQLNELQTVLPTVARGKRMLVRVSAGRLELRWSWMDGNAAGLEQGHVWGDTDGLEQGHKHQSGHEHDPSSRGFKSLTEVVEMAGRHGH